MAQLKFSSKKVNYQIFLEEFECHAQDGFIGDPMGEDGYGYLRVSSDGQTKEEKNGVPRQIENLHNAAKRDGVRIPWEDLFGDDESGYITERPALQELMTTTARDQKKKHLVFESIGRMSREWEWQQGWLLYQFEGLRKMTVHFFDEAGSPLERMFKGYMYGESMKMQKKLMADGRDRKASRGFVPYGKPAFGFRAGAKKGYDPEKIKEFTTWYIKPPDPNSSSGCTQYGEAKIVEEIFETLAYDGLTTYMLCERLQEKYGAPKNYARWVPSFINDIIHNHAYYGKFTHNRYHFEVVEKLGEDGKVTRKKIRRERPQDEWRFVDVQPIVTKELWDLANRALVQNKKMSARNSRKFDSLLIGLLKCAHCGYAWVSDHTRNVVRGKTYHRHYYRCSSDRGYNRNHEINCPTDGFVRQEIVDKIVWTAVWSMIFHPEVLLAHIEQQAESDANRQVQDQIDYIKNQIAHRKRTDERDHELFDADYMKIDEYGPKHKEAVEQIKRWEASIEDLKRKLITQADVQAKKARIMALSEKAKRFKHLGVEAPFDYKQNLIKMCVDVIYVDQPEGKVRIIGEIGDYTRSLNEFIVEDRRCNEQDDDRIVNGYASPAS